MCNFLRGHTNKYEHRPMQAPTDIHTDGQKQEWYCEESSFQVEMFENREQESRHWVYTPILFDFT